MRWVAPAATASTGSDSDVGVGGSPRMKCSPVDRKSNPSSSRFLALSAVSESPPISPVPNRKSRSICAAPCCGSVTRF